MYTYEITFLALHPSRFGVYWKQTGRYSDMGIGLGNVPLPNGNLIEDSVNEQQNLFILNKN